MALNSTIEWTEATWNPITGCTKISDGCLNCYAERMAKRLSGRHGYPQENPFKLTLQPERLLQPTNWKKPHNIFVCSMSDIFHKNVPDNYIFEIINIITQCPQHTFQILTKRAKRMAKISKKIEQWPHNVWIGVTVESKENKKRIDYLKFVNASVRFISFEPLLDNVHQINLKGINWVIVGGESGPGSRPMKQEWATSIRDQCIKMKISYFFKQWGGFNKKATGRSLEGKEWNQMPILLNTDTTKPPNPTLNSDATLPLPPPFCAG